MTKPSSPFSIDAPAGKKVAPFLPSDDAITYLRRHWQTMSVSSLRTYYRWQVYALKKERHRNPDLKITNTAKIAALEQVWLRLVNREKAHLIIAEAQIEYRNAKFQSASELYKLAAQYVVNDPTLSLKYTMFAVGAQLTAIVRPQGFDLKGWEQMLTARDDYNVALQPMIAAHGSLGEYDARYRMREMPMVGHTLQAHVLIADWRITLMEINDWCDRHHPDRAVGQRPGLKAGTGKLARKLIDRAAVALRPLHHKDCRWHALKKYGLTAKVDPYEPFKPLL
jgi:hypothetical protein